MTRRLAWQPVLVAGWPAVALLMAVELLAHRSRSRQHTETQPAAPTIGPAVTVVERQSEKAGEPLQVITLAEVSPTTGPAGEPTAQEIMWAHYLKERAGPDPDRRRTGPGCRHEQLRPHGVAAVARARPHPLHQRKPADGPRRGEQPLFGPRTDRRPVPRLRSGTPASGRSSPAGGVRRRGCRQPVECPGYGL